MSSAVNFADRRLALIFSLLFLSLFLSPCSYNILILLVTYMLPIVSMSYTYFRVGKELWGSQSIGECTAKQMESIKSKRKVLIHPVTIFPFRFSLPSFFFSPFRLSR